MISIEKINNVAILGAGESGTGAAILAQVKEYEVFVSDMGLIADEYKADLAHYGIEWEEGGHTENRILSSDVIIKSPGIPDKAPIVQKAKALGIPVISEIEWASWFTNAKLVGITGANGKTTTTLLTHHLLKNEGLNVGLGGNIGKSFARSVAEDDFDYYVLEISSFQLDDIEYYRNHISVLTNITPDHLDRYNYNIDDYAEAKFKITNKQTAADYFIYNQDDPLTMKYMERFPTEAMLLPISLKEEVFPGAYISNNQLHIGINSKNEIVMNMDDLSLNGQHNRYNTMAAGVVSKILEVRKEVIRESLKSFTNIEHRLEKVAVVNGVEYINDSKATNVNSTWYAMESFNRPLIWIAGGIDKGNDYETLKPLAGERVKALICLGTDNHKLREEFKNEIRQIIEVESMAQAVEKAAELAQSGDVVLLSPACASFDLFKNFEDRGRQFKHAVHNLE